MAQPLQPSGPTVGSVHDDDGDRPTASSLPTSSTHPIISSSACATSLVGEELLAGEGWCTGEGGLLLLNFLLPHPPCQSPLPPRFFTPPPFLSGLPDKTGPLSPCTQHCSPLPLLFWSFLRSCHTIRKMKREGCSKRK